MAGTRSVAVVVTPRQRKVLEGITRTKLAAQQLVERCRVILLSAEGQTNIDQATELGVDRQRVRRWRHRWARAMESLVAAEEGLATDKDFEKLVIGVLMDDARSGAPAKFSPEQVAGIIALGCGSHADHAAARTLLRSGRRVSSMPSAQRSLSARARS